MVGAIVAAILDTGLARLAEEWMAAGHAPKLRPIYREGDTMTNSLMQRLAKVVSSKSKRNLTVLKKVNRAHVKLGLVAATLFVLAYAVETKAILLWNRRNIYLR
jgi:hypothetical protein